MPQLEGVAARLLLESPRATENATLFFARVAEEYEASEEFYSFLSADERARVDRFTDPGRRLRFASSRIVLRSALSYLSVDRVLPEEWVIARTEKGQPRIASPANARYAISLSYSGSLVVLAATENERVGVDVEALAPFPAAEMPSHLLAESEISYLRALPRNLQSECFLRLWTMKEAVSKAQGEGAFADFVAIDVADCAIHLRQMSGSTAFLGGTMRHENYARQGKRYVFSLSLLDVPPVAMP